MGQFKTVALRTYNDSLAAKLVLKEASKDDEYWLKLRKGLVSSEPLKRAEALLVDHHGLDLAAYNQQSDEIATDLFIEKLKAKVPSDVDPSSDEVYRYLTSAESVSLQVLANEYTYVLSDAKAHYASKRTLDRTGTNTLNAAFDLVFGYLGDLPLTEYRRRDVSSVIEFALSSGRKTSTIKRLLGTVRCAVKELIHHYELDGIRNPFEGFTIPNLGHDAATRESFSVEQIEILRDWLALSNGTTANILGLVLDTGARLSEIAGLWVSDLVLTAPIPYVMIHENPMRRLKTKASCRKVPLVGASLEAAQRASSEVSGEFLFPRYMTGDALKRDAASQTLNKQLRKLGCPTVHCLRHTMRTRLRNANVPVPRVNEIQGWHGESMADYYGEQTALQHMREDLLKTL